MGACLIEANILALNQFLVDFAFGFGILANLVGRPGDGLEGESIESSLDIRIGQHFQHVGVDFGLVQKRLLLPVQVWLG